MNFRELYNSKKYVYSLEFFPPKAHQTIDDTLRVVTRLSALDPDFMTVTYGAAGGTREHTKDITSYIARELDIPAVAHLTCVGHTESEIDSMLNELGSAGIKHILALRGDPPKGQKTFIPQEGGFQCARDLTAYIKSRGDFSVAVAGYPEKHPDAETLESDLQYLLEKVQAGGEVVITQLFFESSLYVEFVRVARDHGITVPIVPGVMPVSNFEQLKRFTTLCGATIPEDMCCELEELASDKDKVIEYGIRHAHRLCSELLEAGAPGIHFYTLNRSKQVETLLQSLPRT